MASDNNAGTRTLYHRMRWRLFFWLFLAVLCLPQISFTQSEITSTKDLSIESEFLEAKKYFLIDDLDKAEELFVKLYERENTNPVIALELAKLYKKKKDESQALKYAQLAYDRSAGNQDIADFYGELLIMNDRYDGAIEIYKKLNKQHPDDQEIADKLGTAYVFNQDYEEGIAVYNELEKRHGLREGIIRRKIEAYELSGQKQMIEGELIKLSTYFPKDVDYARNLAIYYKEMGQSEKAQEAFKRVLLLDPDDAAANMALAGNPDAPDSDHNYIRSIIPVLENETIPIDKKIVELLPYLQEVVKNPDEDREKALLAAAETLKNVHPDEAKAYALYGDVLYLRQKNVEAIKAYERSLDLQDNVYSVWENLMQAYKAENRISDLLSRSEEAIDFFPNQATAYMYYADALTYSGKGEKAIGYMEDALLISSGKPQEQSFIYTRMAEMQLSAENYKAAYEALEKAISLEDKNQAAVKLMEEHRQDFFMRGIK